MSNNIKAKGSCLCGAVIINVNNIEHNVIVCHCGRCRKWGGGPLMAIHCGTEVFFEGEDNISVYDSSEWGERGFCQKCGTHLFFRLKENQHYIIPAGLFEDQEFFVLDNQVFIDRKPSFYSFANKTTNVTEAEFFKMYN